MAATATKKAPARKKTTAKAKKAPAKKSTRTKIDGLRKPQVRVLTALKSGKAMTRQTISEKANVDLAMLNSYIGSHDEARRKNNDKRFPCLLTLKYVTFADNEKDSERGVAYQITATGKKALAAALKK